MNPSSRTTPITSGVFDESNVSRSWFSATETATYERCGWQIASEPVDGLAGGGVRRIGYGHDLNQSGASRTGHGFHDLGHTRVCVCHCG